MADEGAVKACSRQLVRLAFPDLKRVNVDTYEKKVRKRILSSQGRSNPRVIAYKVKDEVQYERDVEKVLVRELSSHAWFEKQLLTME